MTHDTLLKEAKQLVRKLCAEMSEHCRSQAVFDALKKGIADCVDKETMNTVEKLNRQTVRGAFVGRVLNEQFAVAVTLVAATQTQVARDDALLTPDYGTVLGHGAMGTVHAVCGDASLAIKSVDVTSGEAVCRMTMNEVRLYRLVQAHAQRSRHDGAQHVLHLAGVQLLRNGTRHMDVDCVDEMFRNPARTIELVMPRYESSLRTYCSNYLAESTPREALLRMRQAALGVAFLHDAGRHTPRYQGGKRACASQRQRRRRAPGAHRLWHLDSSGASHSCRHW